MDIRGTNCPDVLEKNLVQKKTKGAGDENSTMKLQNPSHNKLSGARTEEKITGGKD